MVWDLDQTIVGWNDETTFVINDKAIEVLNAAFQQHIKVNKHGTVEKIIMLTNNSDPILPVMEIEKRLGYRFDDVIDRNHPIRDDLYGIPPKDIETVNRYLGYDVNPDNVWIIDDVKHVMVGQGAHWLHIQKQANNPFGSGFHSNPDLTDYSPLLNAIKGQVAVNVVGGKRKNRKTTRTKRRRRYSIKYSRVY